MLAAGGSARQCWGALPASAPLQRSLSPFASTAHRAGDRTDGHRAPDTRPNSLPGGQLLSSWASILFYFFLNKQTPPTFSLIHTLPSRETTDVESICVTPTYHHAWQPVAISAKNSRANCFIVNYFFRILLIRWKISDCVMFFNVSLC